MAGCKPAYLPVVITAVEALLDDRCNTRGVQCSTHISTPLVIVNGPVRLLQAPDFPHAMTDAELEGHLTRLRETWPAGERAFQAQTVLDPDPALWFLTGQNFWENNPVWLVQHRAGVDSLKVWMDAGTEDIWLPNIEAVHTALVGEGVHVDWHVFPGPHEAVYWIDHVPDYLRFYSEALGT